MTSDKTSDFVKAFGELDDMPFPPSSSNRVAGDLHAALVEYDGYVAGLLLSNKRRPLPSADIDLLGRMQEARSRHPEAADELSLYIMRMKKILEVIELARIARQHEDA